MKRGTKHQTTKQNRSGILPREVKILFNGLFFFSFSRAPVGPPYKRNLCTVGILSTRQGSNQDHNLYVRFGREGSLSAPIEIPHSVLSRLPETIEISRREFSGEPEVTIRGFDGVSGWGTPQNRSNRNVDPDFFNWIIDFEALHHGDLAETTGSLKPKLQFKSGDFYTEEISKTSYTTRQGEEGPSTFGYAAKILGARIVLTDTDQLVINLNGAANPLPMNITRIYLNNVRPKDMQDIMEKEKAEQHQSGGEPVHVHPKDAAPMEEHPDDSQIYYYDLLQGVLPGERFHFEPVLRSEPFICYGSGGSLP